MAAARRKKDEPSFEQSLKRLEEIVRRLEDEQAPLEESLKLFAEGKTLARACEAQLRKAENRVRQLVEGADGELEETPLEETAAPADEEEDADEPAAGEKSSADVEGAKPAKDDDLPF